MDSTKHCVELRTFKWLGRSVILVKMRLHWVTIQLIGLYHPRKRRCINSVWRLLILWSYGTDFCPMTSVKCFTSRNELWARQSRMGLEELTPVNLNEFSVYQERLSRKQKFLIQVIFPLFSFPQNDHDFCFQKRRHVHIYHIYFAATIPKISWVCWTDYSSTKKNTKSKIRNIIQTIQHQDYASPIDKMYSLPRPDLLFFFI